MKITERDILAVVHARDRKGLHQRAQQLAMRSSLRVVWQIGRWILFGNVLVFVFLFLGWFLGWFLHIVELKEDEPSPLAPWLGIPISVIMLLFCLQYFFMLKLELRVTRRWLGNPFRLDYWKLKKTQQEVMGDSPTSLNECLRMAYRRGFFRSLVGDGGVLPVWRYCLLDSATRYWTLLGLVAFASKGIHSFSYRSATETAASPYGVFMIMGWGGMLLLPGIAVFGYARHRRMLRRNIPSPMSDKACPACSYDFQGIQRQVTDEGDEVRCPECGWSGLVEQDDASSELV